MYLLDLALDPKVVDLPSKEVPWSRFEESLKARGSNEAARRWPGQAGAVGWGRVGERQSEAESRKQVASDRTPADRVVDLMRLCLLLSAFRISAEGSTTMAKAKVRIGIIGAGAVSDYHHVPGIRLDPRAELVAVCDADPSLLEKRQGRLGRRPRHDRPDRASAPTRTSTPSSSPRRTSPTSRSPWPPPRPASTSCARSRSA